MRKILVTVGTSLVGHWKEQLEKYDENEVIKITKHLKQIVKNNEKDRFIKLGAEITSTNSLVEHLNLDKNDSILFLCSDTPKGEFVGSLLCSYYRDSFRKAERRVISGIQGTDEKLFLRGLKELVMQISDEIKKGKNRSEEIIINATGGFKAQISFAGLIGQAFSVPVYYQFEDFRSIVNLPPMPVSTDFDLWLSNYQVFRGAAGEADDFPQASELNHLDMRIRNLFDEDEDSLVLNAFGLLYHESMKTRFNFNSKSYLPPSREKECMVSYEDKNHEKHPGLKEYFNKLQQVDYITKLNTWYYNPDLTEANKFKLSTRGYDHLEAWFSAARATTKFSIYFKNETQDPQITHAVLHDLSERFIAR